MEPLPLIWALFIFFAIALYVLLDGFALGIGLLFPFAHSREERDVMMASVVPVWDGNQTWLVGGGAGLLTAFPKALHLLGPALYLPLLVMLIALVFRGVAFEFRFKARDPRLWSLAFVAGSAVAAFCQGLVLGTYVRGFEYDGARLLAGPLHFLSPFSVFVGLSTMAAYALLGACWLVHKTEGALQAWALRRARQLLPAIVVAVALISVWSAWTIPEVRDRWLSWPRPLLLSPIPFWTLVLSAVLYRLLRRPPRADLLPFLCCAGVYLLTLAGLVIGIWPYIVPRVFTFWDLAAPEATLMFALVGVLLIVPLVLVYTGHAYYVFRGKTRPEDVYH